VEYDKASATLDAFIQLHPGYKDIDYAHYLKALCYYDVFYCKTGSKKYLEALNVLLTVVKKISRYKIRGDAQLKMDLVYDHLAGKEMAIGRYYMRQKLYIAAINRFQTVIDAYQEQPMCLRPFTVFAGMLF